MLAPNMRDRNSIEERQGAERAALPWHSFGFESLLRHKLIVGVGAILGLLAGLYYASIRPTLYTAWMELLVYNRQIATGQAAVVLPGRVDIPLVQNQIEVLKSRMVLGKVINSLDLAKDPEFTSRQEGILKWIKSLISPEPPQLVDDDTYDFVLALGALRRNIDVARVGASHIVRMDVRSTDPRKATRIANEITRVYLDERRSGSTGEVPAIRELYRGLGPSAYVVSEVQPPIRPSGMPDFVFVLSAMLLGIGAGSAAAVLRDVLNNRIRNPEQIEHFLGLPCLGALPFVFGIRSAQNPAMVESLGRLTALLREEGGGTLRSLGVTSVMPGDGATTVAINLARSMTRSGNTVLLIGNMPPELRQGTDEFDRRVVSLDALEDVIRDAATSYDFVIVDMPSLASSADARVAARVLDGLLLVIKSDATDCVLASQALHSAAEGQSKFVGTVLNMADPRAVRAYGDRPPLSSTSSAREPRGAPSTVRARFETESPKASRLSESV